MGQISYGPQTGWYIGQFSNGTYYSFDGQNYFSNADPTILINNAMLSGDYVFVGSGSYRLTGSLVPQSNVYLNLSSAATIYQQPLASLGESISLMLSTRGVQNFTVDGGRWNGNKGSLSDHRGTGSWNSNFFKYFGIAFYGGTYDRITIRNVYLENVVGQGIDLRQATNSYIYNCTVINAGDNPITVEADDRSFMSNTIVEKNTVIGGQDVGINTWIVSNVTFKDNIVQNVTQYSSATHWGMAAEYSDYVNFIGNNVSFCYQQIAITGANNIRIIGNVVKGQDGIVDSNQRSTYVYIAYNDLTAITNMKLQMDSSLNVTIENNTGYP